MGPSYLLQENVSDKTVVVFVMQALSMNSNLTFLMISGFFIFSQYLSVHVCPYFLLTCQYQCSNHHGLFQATIWPKSKEQINLVIYRLQLLRLCFSSTKAFFDLLAYDHPIQNIFVVKQIIV